MASSRASELVERGRNILREEGLLVLAKRVFLFVLRSLKSFFFSHGNYYIYEKTLDTNANEAGFTLKIPDCTLKIIWAPKQLDELIAEGFDFGSYTINITRRLRKGAVAFCAFVERDLAHVTYVATSAEAKRGIDYLPFRVNFEGGEVCSGGSFTDPVYRGKGLLSYVYFHIFRYLAGNGVLKDKFTIEVNNIASQKAHAKFNPTIKGVGSYLKILWWEFWKEKPIEEIRQ
jgi:hypothetical protein